MKQKITIKDKQKQIGIKLSSKKFKLKFPKKNLNNNKAFQTENNIRKKFNQKPNIP